MYVYIEPEKGLFTVGFYSPNGKWHPDSDHDSAEGAAERVHYLNGGHSEENPSCRPRLKKGRDGGQET
jgi:hypothetical protein